MKPKKQERSGCDDLFRMRLEQILDQRHALYRVSGKIDWAAVEERFGALYSEEGRPGIPIRLMVGLHYLKHAFNESDETVVECCGGMLGREPLLATLLRGRILPARDADQPQPDDTVS